MGFGVGNRPTYAAIKTLARLDGSVAEWMGGDAASNDDAENDRRLAVWSGSPAAQLTLPSHPDPGRGESHRQARVVEVTSQ